MVAFDDRGGEVTWPRHESFFDAITHHERQHPDHLVFGYIDGWLTLLGLRPTQVTASMSGLSSERLRFTTALATGHAERDYSSVNGMRSEVDGLAKWAGMWPVTSSLVFSEDRRRIDRVIISGENLPATGTLGGPLNVSLLQIGVALESLGYAMLVQANPNQKGNPELLALLRRVCKRVGVDCDALHRGAIMISAIADSATTS